MAAIGAKGGSTPKMTALRKAVVREDDELRQAARDTLRRALAGEQVDSQALAAAKSLFAYRAAAPPNEKVQGEHGPRMEVSFGPLIEVACESKMFSSIGWLDRAAELRMLDAIRARPEQGERRGDAAVDPLPPANENARAGDSGDLTAHATKDDPAAPFEGAPIFDSPGSDAPTERTLVTGSQAAG